MTTEFIGLKDFRQNISKYSKRANLKKIRYIVLKKNTPILDIRPLNQKNLTLEKLANDISLARKEIKEGKFYTQDQIMKEFGITDKQL